MKFIKLAQRNKAEVDTNLKQATHLQRIDGKCNNYRWDSQYHQ